MPLISIYNDQYFMKEAFKEAQKAFDLDEVPVGAVITHKNKIIARAHNQVEQLKDPTAHAEMLSLTSACNFMDNKWLLDCAIYVTIEPCSMCVGALVLSRIKKIVFGAKDMKTGACGSIINLANSNKLNHRIEVKSGILKEDCSLLMTEFFKAKRRRSSSNN